jgi:hypothetical protein
MASQGAKPLRDARVNLADYRVERAGAGDGAPSPTGSIIKLVPTVDGVTRTYELRLPSGAADTDAGVEAWVAAFTAQIAGAVKKAGAPASDSRASRSCRRRPRRPTSELSAPPAVSAAVTNPATRLNVCIPASASGGGGTSICPPFPHYHTAAGSSKPHPHPH